MSHFTVMLKISAERLAKYGGVADAVAAMLAPYQENNMGDCPRQFMEFNDEEDEYRREYANESTEMIRCEDGTLAHPWDERFRVAGTFGTGGGTHEPPAHRERVNVPHRERFASFEEFVSDWHGRKRRDPEKGRYGYWENPNKKWDWYQIGGRWAGFFPLKSSAMADRRERGGPLHMQFLHSEGSDVARPGEIDMDVVAQRTREKAEKFWADWQFFLEHKRERSDEFYGARSRALSLGLCRVVRGQVESVREGELVLSWAECFPRVTDDRAGWHDVVRNIDDDAFYREYIDCFCPIITFAALDADGWHAPGEMGWFGCDNSEPDNKVTFQREFVKRFIKTAAPDDTLVVVDCHI